MSMFITFFVQAVRIGMTLLFGSTGEIITEKSGHLNLGIPGIMCVGASFGCVAESLYTRTFSDPLNEMNPVLAVIIPIIAAFIGGALMGLLYSFLTVSLRANQNVTGLALTTFGVGLSNYMISTVSAPSFSVASKYFITSLPFASKLGWFGEMFLSYGVLVYLAIVIAIVASIVLNKTRVGLQLRAVGENPSTADSVGINVTNYRYIATVIGSGIAGLGGLTFIMDNLYGNWEYMIDSMGWLSIALVIFTLWRPEIAIAGSIVFGGLYIASTFVSLNSIAVKELVKMLPYVVTIIVLVVTSIANKKGSGQPQALGLNYYREDR